MLGNPPGADIPFERVQEHVGEPRIQFLERLARHRNLHVVDDEKGGVNYFRASSEGAGSGAVFIEGQNILACRAMMRCDVTSDSLTIPVQDKGNNKHWAEQCLLQATAQNPSYGKGPKRPFKVPAELPCNQKEAQMRANHEMNLQNIQAVEITVTVPGWFAPDGELWIKKTVGAQHCSIYSPMIFPGQATGVSGSNPIGLVIKGAKHMQDSIEGSRTDVTLCLPNAYGTGTPSLTL